MREEAVQGKSAGPTPCGQASAHMVIREETVRGSGDALGARSGSEVELHGVDLVVCSAWVLDPVWLFDGELAFDDVARALAWLATVFPEVAGRMTPRGVRLCNSGVPLSEVQPAAAGDTAAAPASAFAFVSVEPPRGVLADVRPATRVADGSAPIMTVRLSRFPDGSSALGVCLAHALCDGYGAYRLLLLFARALLRRTDAQLRRLRQEVVAAGFTLSRAPLKALSPCGLRLLPRCRPPRTRP